jgi:hypothetical protein
MEGVFGLHIRDRFLRGEITVYVLGLFLVEPKTRMYSISQSPELDLKTVFIPLHKDTLHLL